MKLHFESDLDFQLEAIEAVCDLFQGQEINRSTFTVTRDALDGATLFDGPVDTDVEGFGNSLQLLPEAIEDNLRSVQLRHGLPPSPELRANDYNFTVEMETGTGKTYVYLRTILELNRRYGFTKFMIVVPSVAIKEGVKKTLEITHDHFRSLYDGVHYEHFLYDSAKLGQVRSYATSSSIQIMVMTVGAINKKEVNNIHKPSEKTGGEKPIDLIRNTRPVIIVDEPQSVDGGIKGKGKEALDGMNALCTLRYSATHEDKHHMVYRLDAVEAYQRQLVKQIEISAATIENAHNKAYVRFDEAVATTTYVRAKVTVHSHTPSGKTREQTLVLEQDDDLQQTTKRDLYKDFRIGEITRKTTPAEMELHYPGGRVWLKRGEVFNDIDESGVSRAMIRRTIMEHLEKELRLRGKGIKVLSLFFIEQVGLYRQYGESGQTTPGEYARAFEEEYNSLRGHPDYATLFASADFDHPTEQVHGGYFAKDKNNRDVEFEYNKNGSLSSGKANLDNAERAYSLIMRNKEQLLSLKTPLKFIFSHSALREGWDNPNVFQICALREMSTERSRRQTIGRGLRICVDQDGQRVRDQDVNTLTVVARESYEDFAKNLQKEIEADTGIRFGIIEQQAFVHVAGFVDDSGERKGLGLERSKEIWSYLALHNYIDGKGKIQEKLKRELDSGRLEIPNCTAQEKLQIKSILKRHSRKVEVKDATTRRTVMLREGVLDNPEFRALWDRVKHKTTYQLDFDDEALIEKCTRQVRDMPAIPIPRINWSKAKLDIDVGGVDASKTGGGNRLGTESVKVEERNLPLPDVLSVLMNQTQLTRKSLAKILVDSLRLDEFKRNPQKFIEQVSEVIKRAKQTAIVDGIKYHAIGESEVFAQELFRTEELQAYLEELDSDGGNREVVMDEHGKTPYPFIRYDSAVERKFAEALSGDGQVKFFAKLPKWFKVDTPLGTYNPDWAVNTVDEQGHQHLYLVVETKSGLFEGDLRSTEEAKIACGKEHFAALGTFQQGTLLMEERVEYRAMGEWGGRVCTVNKLSYARQENLDQHSF